MSRLTDKIEAQKKIVEEAREALDTAQSVLDALEYKAKKARTKSDIKKHRKKLLTDPAYALMYKINTTLFIPDVSKQVVLEAPFLGLNAQLKLEEKKEQSMYDKIVAKLFYGRFKKEKPQ